MPEITPFLWFDNQAEEAATLYTSLFPNSRITEVSRYGEAGPGPAGTAMTVSFEVAGQRLIALNGGPDNKLNEAFSLMISVETQDEVDQLWAALTADGGEEGPCGWCKDRYGLSWQVVPTALPQLLTDPDPERAGRAMTAMMKMTKIDIQGLRDAADGR
jgi:predicted 3-demethylubiquinone-9 3-methyltransferase (glyoxalase superfamily)